jgi:hypothetical protein
MGLVGGFIIYSAKDIDDGVSQCFLHTYYDYDCRQSTVIALDLSPTLKQKVAALAQRTRTRATQSISPV